MPDRPQLTNASYLVENAAWVRYWYVTAIFSWPLNLALFLFGLLAGRHQVLTRLAKSKQTMLAIVSAGLTIGVGLYFMREGLIGDAQTPLGQSLRFLTFTLHCWAMSSAYMAALLLALRTQSGVSILAVLAAIGRTALTNYLMQAALIVPACLAFGLFDRFTPTLSLLLTLVVFVMVQIPFSLLWLKRFQFGPAEWLWRWLTYGRVPSLKLSDTDCAPAAINPISSGSPSAVDR